MTRICTQKEIRECVLLSTCNRTELYTVSEENISVRSVMTAMQRIMLDMAGIGDAGEVSEHLRFYQGTQAVRHLFYVQQPFSDGSDSGQESQDRDEAFWHFCFNGYIGGESGGNVFWKPGE